MCGGRNSRPGVGEKVTAFIVPRPGNTVVPGDVKSFLKTRPLPFQGAERVYCCRRDAEEPCRQDIETGDQETIS